MTTVAGKCWKFYAILHIFSYLMKVTKNKKKWKDLLKKTLKNYVGSIFFMMTLVGGLKFSLCINSYLQGVADGFFLMKAAIPSSLCIIFEDSFRRKEISYFTLVRALRSLYIFLKRRNIVSLNK